MSSPLPIKTYLFLVSALILATPIPAQPRFFRDTRPCGHFCSFRMCQFNASTSQFFAKPVAPFSLFGLPQDPDIPVICKVGSEETMDLVEQVGEARVFDPTTRNFVPISLWRPQGLSHAFPADFINAYEMPVLSKSGISYSQPTQGNQWSYLHDRCMILPIHKYYERIESGIQSKSTMGEPNACAAFRITAPELRFHLDWDSADDFDLLVLEPDGDFIESITPYSESGKLNKDENRLLCLSDLPGGKENIVYFPGNGRQAGQYEVDVTMVTKCRPRQPTTWILTILFNGVLIRSSSGIVEEGPALGEVLFLGTETITLP